MCDHRAGFKFRAKVSSREQVRAVKYTIYKKTVLRNCILNLEPMRLTAAAVDTAVIKRRYEPANAGHIETCIRTPSTQAVSTQKFVILTIAGFDDTTVAMDLKSPRACHRSLKKKVLTLLG